MADTFGQLESAKTFEDTPEGWQARWHVEMSAARSATKKWHEQGHKIVNRFLDKERSPKAEKDSRLNLFTSNVQTLEALLFGRVPTVDVMRRYADAQDDEARVGGEMLQRLLNSDLERPDEKYPSAMKQALQDRLLSGMGNARVRYVVRFETVPETPPIMAPAPADPMTGQAPVDPETGEPMQVEQAPAVPEHERKADEDVEVDYVYWADQLWSPAKTFDEMRWWAFKVPMTRDELVEKFGKDVGEKVPLNLRKHEKETHEGVEDSKGDPWDRAEVWEIWDKDNRCCWWYVEGYDQVLVPEGVGSNENGSLEDPLGLQGFWPFPRPLVANLTTSEFMPRPDYVLAQDLYDEIDLLSTRITLLEKAIRVTGVYDKSEGAVVRLLTDACENELVPIENWHQFTEKGGVKGAVDWMPLDMITGALDKLVARRQELISLLFQVTGMSDIMRGQSTGQTTATEQAIKAKFASVRVQSFQNDFAQLATDVQFLKAEIISKHFEMETIITRSNVMYTQDKNLAQAGAKLIKERFPSYRIVVKPESVSLTDYAAMKQERTEWVTGIATFLQSAVPLLQVKQDAWPFLLQLLQWTMAGMRGSGTIEAALDQMVAGAMQQQKQAAMQPKQPPPPDPKVQAAQIGAQADQQKIMLEHKTDMARIGAEAQTQISVANNDAKNDVLKEEHKQQREGLVAMLHQVGGVLPGKTGV